MPLVTLFGAPCKQELAGAVSAAIVYWPDRNVLGKVLGTLSRMPGYRLLDELVSDQVASGFVKFLGIHEEPDCHGYHAHHRNLVELEGAKYGEPSAASVCNMPNSPICPAYGPS